MRHALLLVTALSLALLATACGGEEPDTEKPGPAHPDPAHSLLQEAIEAMGGDAALAGIKGMRAKYRGTYEMGGMPMPYTSEAVFVAPDRMVWNLLAQGFTGSMCLDGETTWARFMTPPARCRGAMDRSIREMADFHEVHLLRPLLHRKDLKIETPPGDEGRQVLLTFPSGRKLTLGFSAGDSGKTTLVSIEGDITHWDGSAGTLKMTLSDPKPFGPVTLPSKYESRTFVGDEQRETIVEEIVSIEWNPEVEDADFAMPELALELDVPALRDVAEFSGLVIVHEGPYSGMSDTITKVMKACRDAGLIMSGGVTAVYLTDPMTVEDPADLRTEIAVPVVLMGPPPTDLPEGVTIKTFSAVKAASMTVRGPYGETDAKALGRLSGWVGEQGREIAGPPRVLYHHNPDGTVPEDQVAEVQIPVK